MDSQSPADEIPFGQFKSQTNSGSANAQFFLIQQLIDKIQTATLVKIVKCTNSGGLSEVGYVDILPLVNLVDGAGNQIQHEPILNVPYFRVQGGKNAVIIDPEIGDIGICVFASRDISKVKSTKKQANPGTFRRYNYADGLYFGGVLNGSPTQYVQFNSGGITLSSPSSINIKAPTININAGESCTITTPTFTVNGATNLNGNVTAKGELSATGAISSAGLTFNTHVHGGIQTGSSNTGTPK